jgi:ribonuclease BN (tRNA processing enzyme)
MQFRFIGCGDAFGSGGRFNTCFNLTGGNVNVLIDCGASSVIAMKQQGIRHNDIDAIFFTHYHADHFGGLPFLILDAQFFSKRTRPLTLVGPAGLAKWYERVMETAFPGSSGTKQKFDLTLVEIAPGEVKEIAGVTVTASQAVHGNPDGPFLSLRLEAEGKSVAYTGDSEWTDAIIDVAKNVDLFVTEAYFRDKPVRLHLDLATVEAHLDAIAPKRVILTHMSDDMLAQLGDLPFETAEDGMVVDI